MTSVLVIDDHPVARHGCRRVLERIGITTIFEAGDGVTGYELFGRHRPDVVIVDLALGANCLGGLSLIRRFSSENPKAHILVLSMHNDPNIVSRALEAGATVGTGIEVALGRNWSVKAEYLFVDLGNGSCTTDCAIANAAGPAIIPNIAVKFDESIVRGDINYRFSL